MENQYRFCNQSKNVKSRYQNLQIISFWKFPLNVQHFLKDINAKIDKFLAHIPEKNKINFYDTKTQSYIPWISSNSAFHFYDSGMYGTRHNIVVYPETTEYPSILRSYLFRRLPRREDEMNKKKDLMSIKLAKPHSDFKFSTSGRYGLGDGYDALFCAPPIDSWNITKVSVSRAPFHGVSLSLWGRGIVL